jgi:hypothetical protein
MIGVGEQRNLYHIRIVNVTKSMSSESEPIDEIVAVDAIMATSRTISETTDRKEFWVDNDTWTINPSTNNS